MYVPSVHELDAAAFAEVTDDELTRAVVVEVILGLVETALELLVDGIGGWI